MRAREQTSACTLMSDAMMGGVREEGEDEMRRREGGRGMMSLQIESRTSQSTAVRWESFVHVFEHLCLQADAERTRSCLLVSRITQSLHALAHRSGRRIALRGGAESGMGIISCACH